jgi:hypothetical protein
MRWRLYPGLEAPVSSAGAPASGELLSKRVSAERGAAPLTVSGAVAGSIAVLMSGGVVSALATTSFSSATAISVGVVASAIDAVSCVVEISASRLRNHPSMTTRARPPMTVYGNGAPRPTAVYRKIDATGAASCFSPEAATGKAPAHARS